MTVMIGRFFGLPQELIRRGIWKQMKPGEIDLYTCLAHRSERNRNRKLMVSDAEVHEEVGTAARTLCNARKKLQERGLIKYERERGGRYTYELCDPSTGRPYPGPSNVPVIPTKQDKANPEPRRENQDSGRSTESNGKRPPPEAPKPLLSPAWKDLKGWG